jgi:hypothetical protein
MKEFSQGDIVFCVERDCGMPESVVERMVLAKVEKAYITITPIKECDKNEYKNLKETVDDCVQKTEMKCSQEMFFVPEYDCYATKEEAENAVDEYSIPLF